MIQNLSKIPKCSNCGGFHFSQNHQLPDFPQDPRKLVDDLVKMGVYQPSGISLTNHILESQSSKLKTKNYSPIDQSKNWQDKKHLSLSLDKSGIFSCRDFSGQQLKDSLLKNQTDNHKNHTYQLAQELIKKAGGLDAISTAIFSENIQNNFPNYIRNYDVTRRKFIEKIVVTALLVSLTNCSLPEIRKKDDLISTKLEKTNLKIGFIPITCATPIIMSAPLGFYDKYGLKVELVKMKSWEQIRDSAIAGELDAYHMLSPMPLAMSLGLDSLAFPINLVSIQNINGNAITVGMKHRGKVTKPEDFKGFKIAIPFVYSMHNLLLRYYLAAGKINPDKDVEIMTIPPAEMMRKLETGEIDAMIVAEPFNQLAVTKKIGFIHILSRDIWPGHPCCSFAASQQWISQNPNTFRALNKAIIDSSIYAQNPLHRREIAQAISAPEYINVPEGILIEILTGRFPDGNGTIKNFPDRIDFDPYPWKSFSYWITSQLVRWNLLANNIDHENIADEVFLTSLARQIAKQLGQTPPTIILRYEQLKYDTFDPSEPEEYARQQIKKYGF